MCGCMAKPNGWIWIVGASAAGSASPELPACSRARVLRRLDLGSTSDLTAWVLVFPLKMAFTM